MDNSLKPLTIQMSFAYDANKNTRIEPEEVVKNLSELDQYDKDDDKKLKGTELEGVYYQLGEDKWAPAGQPYYDKTDSTECTYLLKELDLKNGSIKMDINCSILA